MFIAIKKESQFPKKDISLPNIPVYLMTPLGKEIKEHCIDQIIE